MCLIIFHAHCPTVTKDGYVHVDVLIQIIISTDTHLIVFDKQKSFFLSLFTSNSAQHVM